MSPRGRLICGGLAVALVLLMLWLFRSSPDLDFPGDEDTAAFTIECDPLMWAWGRTFAAPDASSVVGGGYNGYDVESGEPPEPDGAFPGGADEIEAGLARYCEGARAARAGLIGLVAFPASLLGAAALIRFPREIRISRSITRP